MMLMKPDLIYKTNYKVMAISSFDSLPDPIKDSVWKANTIFLDSINDSLFISDYIRYLETRLKSYGLKVFTQDSMGAFLSESGMKFIVHFFQCEMEEFIDMKRFDFAFEVEGKNTERELLVNAVNLNNWFEITMLNTNHSKDTVFSSETMSDVIDGSFVYYYLSGDVDFNYNYYSLTADDIAGIPSEAGRINGSYLFDYFMNAYILVNLNKSLPSGYYHYKGYKKKIRQAQDRFEPVHQPPR